MKNFKDILVLLTSAFCLILFCRCKKHLSSNQEAVLVPESFPVDTSLIKPSWWHTQFDSVSKRQGVSRSYYTLKDWDSSKASVDALYSAFKYFYEQQKSNYNRSNDLKTKYETIYYDEDGNIILTTDF